MTVNTPSNFSIFLVPKRKPLSSSSFKSGMILRLKSLHAKWDEKNMKDAVKQGVACPTSVNEMIHQLKNFAHLCAFFFTESSFAFRFFITLIERVKSHLTVLESAQHRDNLFVTKFCFALDTRFFRWMEQCKQAKDREDVNDQLLNFSTMLDSVLIDQFYQTLPSTMKLVSDKPSHQTSAGVNSKPSKKQKTKNETEDRKVDNKKPVPAWICKESEDYREIFAGKNCTQRPKIGNFPMCVRFHTKGFCFSDCINKSSHLPSQDLPQNTKTSYSNFIKICRG